MSRIQFDLKIDLPRAMGSAWKVPMGRLRVVAQVVEIGGLVAVLDAFQDRQVDLHQRPRRRRRCAAGTRRHRCRRSGRRRGRSSRKMSNSGRIALRYRAASFQRRDRPHRPYRSIRLLRPRPGAEHRGVVAECMRKAFVDDDGCVDAQDRGRRTRLLEAADDDRPCRRTDRPAAAACAILLASAGYPPDERPVTISVSK